MSLVQESPTLLERQFLFSRKLAVLLQKAEALGYHVTMGECWRSTATARLMAEEGKGITGSLHTQRLAVDLNLFHDREYQSSPESYRELGEWWEHEDPLCCWGGRFGDANHFSVTDGHRK